MNLMNVSRVHRIKIKKNSNFRLIILDEQEEIINENNIESDEELVEHDEDEDGSDENQNNHVNDDNDEQQEEEETKSKSIQIRIRFPFKKEKLRQQIIINRISYCNSNPIF